MAVFLSRWIAQASDEEIALLGVGQQGWTRFGSQPKLYDLFLSDYSFRKQLDVYLAPLQAALRRVPAMREQAPWQSLLARAQLDAGEVDAALISARRAWKLDGRLCAEDCSPLLLAWLQSGTVPGPQAWPELVAPAVFNPASVDCESAPDSLQPERLAWAIPPDDLVGAVLSGRSQVAWLLREQWAASLRGCNRGAPLSLTQALKEHYSGFELEQAWRALEVSLRALPSPDQGDPHLRFLGQDLPLPAQECDFTHDPDCRSAYKPLTRDGIRMLLASVRSASRRFSGPANCSGPGEPFSNDKQRAMRAALASIDDLQATEVLLPLRDLLHDQAFARMWATDVPFEIAELMTDLARTDRQLAADTLQLTTEWIAAAPIEMQQSPSAGDLLAVLLLRNGRPQDGLVQLELAQERLSDLDRARRISQLRAGLEGANLDATLPQAAIPRPWIHGVSSSEKAVWARLPYQRTQRLDGVRVVDVIYGLGGAEAVARRHLRSHWLPSLLGHADSEEDLIAALRAAYGEAGLRKRMLKAITDMKLSPTPHLRFEQVSLPLPDQICTADRCTSSQAVNRRWVLERLRGWLGELSEAEEMQFLEVGEQFSPTAVRSAKRNP
ncbi:MAG: hypothetical protein ACT4NL_01865 [Pseudomarimonas sp.]